MKRTRPGDWAMLPPLPAPPGVAGAYAGTVRGALVVAGGANFPDAPPWAGGAKVWHDAIHVLDRPDGPWRTAGRLPAPRGYGASWSTRHGIVLAGGSDSVAHHANAWLLTFAPTGTPRPSSIAPLPIPLANAGFASDRGALLVVGGHGAPNDTSASARVFRLRRAPTWAWDEMPELPGGAGRILPWVARLAGGWCAGGGAALEAGPDGKARRRPLRDAWWLADRASRWAPLPDTPAPVIAAPCPCPVRDGAVHVLPADDASRAGIPQQDHPGFPRSGWKLSARRDRWEPSGPFPFAQVTTTTVEWHGRTVVPSGEIRPGVRTVDVRWGTVR